MVSIDVEYLPSYYNKLNPQAFKHSAEDFIEKLTHELEDACELESPVRTGALRDGHYSEIKGLESYVGNTMEYAPYVIHGTSKQAPNNYPSRAINRVITSTYLRLLLEDYLRYNGIEIE